MLFLPESVYDARIRLKRDLDAGKVPAEEAFQKMLEADPHDYISLLELGDLRREAGDLDAAEEYFWRAVHAHPCVAFPYMALARLLYARPGSAAMSDALGELGIAKRALLDGDFLKGVDFETIGIKGKALKEFRKLPPALQGRMIAASLRANRGGEPEAVTERLRQLRLIDRLQEEGDLSAETVDSILEEGESIVPLLVGVLRSWAQDLLGDDGDGWVENALALLGETASAAEIPHLIEFADLENEDARGAASWALGRILDRHPREAAQCIGAFAASLGPAERLVIAEQILRHPDSDPSGKLLVGLGEDLSSMPIEDRDVFLPLFLTTIAVGRGSEVVKLGRAMLLRQRALLSRHARRECEDLLNSIPPSGVPPLPMEPSPFTVYEICGGDAYWGDHEEGDDEEDGVEEDGVEEDGVEEEEDFVPEPVRRPATPGRNDPCWCNSGKKYKKCHLDSDQRRDSAVPGKAPAVSLRPSEFVGLRGRLGEFLGQLPERDIKLALHELFGDQVPLDKEGANLTVTDWMIHDWIPPSFGRTLLQEFLVRRGPQLSQREREMIEAWSRSFVGLYEVQELTAGVGVKLKDLIFGETFFVHDVNMSTQLSRWDGLLTRVVPGERGLELTGAGFTVPRHSMEPLRAWMDRDREETGLEWREYLKKNWPRIRRQSFEIAAKWVESLRLSNTDGEELLLSKALYAIVDEAAALRALRNFPDLQDEASEADPRKYFVWLDRKKTVLAKIRVETNELRLDCNSKERLERGKLLLSEIAGGSLRHLRDEFTTQKELKSRAAATPEGAAPSKSPLSKSAIPKEVRDEIVGNYLEDHYRAWPDTKLPALNGKTPRQAAKTAKGRKQLLALFKDFENGEDRKKKAGEPSYDFSRLRAELGLES